MNISEEFAINYFSSNSENERVQTIIDNFNISINSPTLNNARNKVTLELCKILALFGVELKDFHFYGSTNIGMCLVGDYDLDITLMLSETTCDIVKKLLHPKKPNKYNVVELFYDKIKISEQRVKLEKLIFKASWRCPAISFNYKPLGVQVDFTINNWLSIENTKLMEDFISIPLMVNMKENFNLKFYILLLKLWFKSMSKNCEKGFHLSSYGFTVMIIHFLLTKHYLPPIMSFDNSEKITMENNNPKSYHNLLFEFFHYYVNEYNPQEEVANIAHIRGEKLTRENLKLDLEKIITHCSVDQYSVKYRQIIKKYVENFNDYRLDYNAPLIVQDPFELTHNLAKAITLNDYKRLVSCMNITLQRFSVDKKQNHIVFDMLHLLDWPDSMNYSWIERNKTTPHFSISLGRVPTAKKIELFPIFGAYLKHLISILINEFICTVTFNLKNYINNRLEPTTYTDDAFNRFIIAMENSKLLSLTLHSSMQCHWWKNSRRRRRAKIFSNVLDESATADEEIVNYELFCRLNPFTWSFDYYIRNLDDKSGNFVDFCALLNKKIKNAI